MVKLKWLNRPHRPTVVTWGVPWAKGKLNQQEQLSLWDGKNKIRDHEVRPSAFWPDGSIKWTFHSAVLHKEEHLQVLVNEEVVPPVQPLKVEETASTFKIDTSGVSYRVQKRGNILIDSIKKHGHEMAKNVTLRTIIEQRQESKGKKVRIEESFQAMIKDVEVETKGLIRTVLKVSGHHTNEEQESILPFVVRLEFGLRMDAIKITHTQFIDINPNQYFIKGMGWSIESNLVEDPWNQFVQIGTETGMYNEPAQLALTRKFKHANGKYSEQINNLHVDLESIDGWKEHVTENAIWNDFKITHLTDSGYKMSKRTSKDHAWIDIAHGNRAKGVLNVGSGQGAITIGYPNLWRKHPAGLEVRNLANGPALTVWLWSPDSEAMDLRHYSNEMYVKSAYEGFEENRATPEGIANTNTLFISFFDSIHEQEKLNAQVKDWQDQPLLICESAYYQDTNVFGTFSLPRYETPFYRFIEDQLDRAFTFYNEEIEQRSWYGFWDYGDVMHTYDPIRHQWRYDLGGYAWQNTELVPNIWLWYMFLRSGRKDVFELAEAMTRHTSEVDCYHFGAYKGLGSRHNVRHWGCGCKEVRVSMAGLYRYYYYLTGDERTGELLTEVKDADFATKDLDPMREYFPKDQYPTHVRTGPDWSAFTSNWMVEWERTGNMDYRNKITTGMNILKNLPLRLLSGPTFGYDPETSKLFHLGDGTGGYHMIIAFGAPQVWMELADLLKDDEWKEMLAEFGEFYVLADEEKKKRTNGLLHDPYFHWPMFAAALTAYAAKYKQDQDLAEKAWNLLLNPKYSHTPLPIKVNEIHSWKRLREVPWITTNTISQWCLNMMVCLELLKDMPPSKQWQESINSQKAIN